MKPSCATGLLIYRNASLSSLNHAPVRGPVGVQDVPDEGHATLEAVLVELAGTNDLAEGVHGFLELDRSGADVRVHLVQHRLVGEHVRGGLVGVPPGGAVRSGVGGDLPDGALGSRHESHDILDALLGGDRLSETGRGEGKRCGVANSAVGAHDAVNDSAEVSLVGEDVDERLLSLDALREIEDFSDIGLTLPSLQLGILGDVLIVGVVGVDKGLHEVADRLSDNGSILVEREGLEGGTEAAVDEALVLEEGTVIVALEAGSLTRGVDLVSPLTT